MTRGILHGSKHGCGCGVVNLDPPHPPPSTEAYHKYKYLSTIKILHISINDQRGHTPSRISSGISKTEPQQQGQGSRRWACIQENKTAHASAASAPAILPIRRSAKSLKQQNKGLSKKSTKKNEIEDKDSDTNSLSAIEIDDDDQNGPKNQDDDEPQVTEKVETAEEERSMSKIYSQVRRHSPLLRRAPVESLDLTCLYVFPPTSPYWDHWRSLCPCLWVCRLALQRIKSWG